MKDKKSKLLFGLLALFLVVGFANATTIKDNAVSIFTGGIDLQGANLTNAKYFISQDDEGYDRFLNSYSHQEYVANNCADANNWLLDLPFNIRHRYILNLSFTDATCDLLIPTYSVSAWNDLPTEAVPLTIRGDTGNADDVVLGSIYGSAGQGYFLTIYKDFTVSKNNPYDNENSAIAFYGGGEVELSNIKFNSATINNGVLAYGNTHIFVQEMDFGTGNIINSCYKVKHGARIFEESAPSNFASSGTCGDYAYNAGNGYIFIDDSSTLQGTTSRYNLANGFIYDGTKNTLYGLDMFNTSFTFNARSSSDTPITIDQNYDQESIRIDTESTSEAGLIILADGVRTGTDTNSVGYIRLDNPSSTGTGFEIDNDGSGIGLRVRQDGNGVALKIESASTNTVPPLLITPTISVCSSVYEGAIYYNTTSNKHYGCDGGVWNALY